MSENTVYMVISVLVLILFAAFATLLISQAMEADKLKNCAESDKTYFKYQEGAISFQYCGDVKEMQSLLEQVGAIK